MVFPETALIVRAQRCFSRLGGMRVDVGERELPVDEPYSVGIVFFDDFERREQAAAMRTFEIREFDDRDRRVGRSS